MTLAPQRAGLEKGLGKLSQALSFAQTPQAGLPQVVGQAVRDLHESLIHRPDRDLENVFRANVGLSTGLELQRYVTFM